MIHKGAWVHETARVAEGSELGAHAQIGAGSRIERAVIEGTVGANCKVWRFAHIMTGAVVGNDCMIAQNVFIADGARVGNRVRVQNNTCISTLVDIHDDVYIGSCVSFCNSVHPSSKGGGPFCKITVEKGASIGANVSIVGKVTIGERAVIGAGAVVTKDVPEGSTYAGVPAREIQCV